MKKRRSPILIPFLALVCVIGLRILFPSEMNEFQLKVFDAFQRMKPRTYIDGPVRVVDIDDETLAQFGQWPWPRIQFAKLLDRLNELGAKVISLDMVFSEPDRTSPKNVLPLWPVTNQTRALAKNLDQLPEHDRVLAEAMTRSHVVTGFSFSYQPMNVQPALKAGFAFSGEPPNAYLPNFKGAIINLPEIEKAAVGNGAFNLFREKDGIVRRIPLIFRYGDQIYPSLVAEALRVALGASTYVVKTAGGSGEISFGERTGIVSLKIGNVVLPTDAHGRIWLYDTDRIEKRIIPARKILDGEVDPEEMKNAIVFIGTSAAGLKDIKTTPLHPAAAGVEVHAQLAEQILYRQFLYRPDWATGAEMLYLLLLGLVLILLMRKLNAVWCALIAALAIGGVISFSLYAFTTLHWLLDPVFPSLAALFLYLTVSMVHFLRTETEKRHIRHAFSRYMSPALVERLADHPDQLKLGGETKTMTFLFADIRSFTAISEQYDAHGLTHLMNRYLTPMTELILKENGTIDKYIGDCIMAFWNAPLDDPSHAKHACQAALNMQDHLKKWNAEMQHEAASQNKTFTPIQIGIGINTGSCCVGNLGSDYHFDYSVLGDEVNLASRLESLSKLYGAMNVVGENTAHAASELAVLEMDLIRVKGKTKPSRIFTLLGDTSLRQESTFVSLSEKHQNMLTAYRNQNWSVASRWLGECVGLMKGFLPLEEFYNLYQRRINELRTHPTRKNWDGVTLMASK